MARAKIYGREPERPKDLRDQQSIREVLHRFERMADFWENHGRVRDAQIMRNALTQLIEKNNDAYLRAIKLARSIPVSIDEFIESEDFMDNRVDVWPKLRDELRALKPDIMLGHPSVLEVLNSSCIGTGKSELGKITLAYDLYFLSCYNEPQLLFKSLNRYTPILFIMQSIRPSITNRSLYMPFKDMFLDMRYTRKYLKWNKDKENVLEFDNGTQVVPMVASPSAFIGQAVLAAHIDEANFMEVVDTSRKVAGPDGKGGHYDQAEQLYRNISRRRKSRFLTSGPNPGLIYVSSSVHYRDDFLDRRMREVRAGVDTHIKILNFRQFDVKPTGFSGKTFKFLVGTNDYPPKILPDDAQAGVDYPAGGQVEDVPVEFEEDFRNDPENAQRDNLGIASTAISRFIAQTHKITGAIQLGKEYGLEPFVHKQNVVLDIDECFPRILEDKLPKDKDVPRFVHVDLSRTGDRCGIAMVKVVGHSAIERSGVVEVLPTYIVELAVTIEPSPMHHIDIAEVRSWIMLLKTYHGLNIKCVTYDGFDSQESIQLWRRAGIQSFEISMDRSTEAYDDLKAALYQDRLLLVDNPLVKDELAQLERKESGGRSVIDHRPRGTKDGSDSVAGACKSASLNRSIRAEKHITDLSGIPISGQGRRTMDRRPSARR